MNKQPSNQQPGGQQQLRQAGGQTDPARQQQQFQAGGGGNLAGQIRENMQVIGVDNAPVGLVHRVEGDRIKLERSAETGRHSYLSIENVQAIEGNKVRLGVTASAAEKLATQA
jgi:hypothetical protein